MAMTDDIEENEMSEEEVKAVYRMNETDILQGLIKAGSYKAEESTLINIKRGGQVVFSFRIHPLSETDYFECRKNNTKYKRNKQTGQRVSDSVDNARYRSELIYKATLDEDKNKLWDNHAAWNQFNVLTGIDLIDAVLMAGEKDEILSKLDEMSGYASMEETAKN